MTMSFVLHLTSRDDDDGDHETAREVLAVAGVPDGDGSAPKGAPVMLARLTGAGWSLAAAAGWLVLALTHPTTTYHLAPLLLTALAWPLAAARQPDRATSARNALRAVVGSALLAGVALGILALTGALDGPALIGSTAPWSR